MSSLKSLIHCGTKLWLDSIDPQLVQTNFEMGATGATSNPVIIADLLETGRFDDRIEQLIAAGKSDEDIAWTMTDELVQSAQQVFMPVWEATKGNDGYVSFELDPLMEDADNGMSHDQRVQQYVHDGTKWSQSHQNRMIKVPATPAGLGSLEALAAAGVPLNVTLIFTMRQYEAARDAIWRGAQTHGGKFKSVYSIFISRVDVYTSKHVPELSEAAQGLVGIVNAQRIWAANQEFWAANGPELQQEIVFASTGTKNAADKPWKYVEALAGSDIQTNPPKTNDAADASGLDFVRTVDRLPDDSVLQEIDDKVDEGKLESVLMEEGIAKFAGPQAKLIERISERRMALQE